MFTEEDQAAALVWDEADRDKCPGCGNSVTESTDPATQGEWVATPVRCFACQSREHMAHDFAENGDPAGLLWTMGVTDGD